LRGGAINPCGSTLKTLTVQGKKQGGTGIFLWIGIGKTRVAQRFSICGHKTWVFGSFGKTLKKGIELCALMCKYERWAQNKEQAHISVLAH